MCRGHSIGTCAIDWVETYDLDNDVWSNERSLPFQLAQFECLVDIVFFILHCQVIL